MIGQQVHALLAEALERLRHEGFIPEDVTMAVELTRPARAQHGDFATNLALSLGSKLRTSPRAVADRVIAALAPAEWLAKVEVAGPGFINFFLTHAWLADTIVAVATEGERFGRLTLGEGITVNVEFVSANPTGPLHVGAGRNAAYGDALAQLLDVAGYSVSREYYINDAGRQIDQFAASLEARYLQALGQEAAMPEDGYNGQYLVDLGQELAAARGSRLVGRGEEIREWGLERMLERIRTTLEHFGVSFDCWFSERSLHESGKIAAAVERMREAGVAFVLEGALWFRATDFGDSRDRVLLRSDGRPTYLTADIAYLIDKAERGNKYAVYVWGADHHGAVASLEAAALALELPIVVEVLLYQLVNLLSGGEAVRMSKRTGEVVSLDELVDEVGVDAARFTFLLRSLDSQLDFDLALVTSQSQENPVYYAQYAHARICSILRLAQERGVEQVPVGAAALGTLMHDSEIALGRLLSEYPETIEVAARLRAPYRLTTYAHDVAAAFHAFYRDCRVLGDDLELTRARLWLVDGARQVLANTLGVLGVSAPERM